MTLLLFYLLLAISISFLCSILEAVLLSISPSYIESLKESDPETGIKFKKLKDNIDNPLSAILSLNTIAHTVGATGVGAQAVRIYGEAYVGIISAVVTLLILIFSEIIPKSIGAIFWKRLAPISARVLTGLVIIMYPLVIMSKFITNFITSKRKQPVTSREEVAALASMGSVEGVFEEEESRIINNLLRLRNIYVEDIMTPRTVVVAAREELTVDELFQKKEYFRFSRIPIYHEKLDNINGFIMKYDILDHMANDKHHVKLIDLKRELLTVYERIPVSDFFEKLLQSREHIALVVDEYGGVSGVATMEDVLETLLGLEIVDEFDQNADMQQLARDKWKERAKRLGIIQDTDD